MQRTEWFPPSITPVHKGFYECRTCTATDWETGEQYPLRHYWDGRSWRWHDLSEAGRVTSFSWRGLAAPAGPVV